MSAELRVTTRIQGTIGILDIAGDVTDTAHDPLMSAYQDVVHRGAKRILLTFHPKSFINSAGIRVIMAITFEAESRKQALGISGLSPHMAQIFHLVGLTNYTKLFPTGEEALKNWK